MRVGIDLVSVSAVAQAMGDHGERYLRRIYTDGELSDCRGEGRSGKARAAGGAAHDAGGEGAAGNSRDDVAPERLAARFAAKEATLKVLRPEDQAIPWCDIEVVRQPAGWVQLRLGGRAAAAAAAQGLGDFALSISHEGGYATAVVVAA